jgi:hypothetical protein
MSDILNENWAQTKETLLEGLESKKKDMVAPLLENQRSYMLQENAADGATAAHDVSGYRKILMPMIRRVIPGTIASEIVGVQPMSGPVSQVYTLRYKYNDGVTSPADATNPFGGNNVDADDEAFGNDPALRQYYSGAGVGGTSSAGELDAGAYGIGGSETDEEGTGLGGAWGSTLGSDDDTAGTSTFAEGARNVRGNLRGGSGSTAEGSGGRRMKMEVLSQAVESGTRKLQAGWTIEAMQDLNSQHGLDVENEMTQALSAEITQEIDAEVIADLLALAGTAVGAQPANAQTWDQATTSTGMQPAFLGDKYANLGVTINYVANEIARRTRRGAGNFVVVSPMIVSLLQSASKSVFAPAIQGSFKGPNNTELVGTLNGTIKVYSYLWNQTQPGTDDTILVGYKGGNGEIDAGYFYCPYIPLMSSGVVVNPTTFQPVVSLMTRYGKTAFTDASISLGNSADYYGKITVSNVAFS